MLSDTWAVSRFVEVYEQWNVCRVGVCARTKLCVDENAGKQVSLRTQAARRAADNGRISIFATTRVSRVFVRSRKWFSIQLPGASIVTRLQRGANTRIIIAT